MRQRITTSAVSTILVSLLPVVACEEAPAPAPPPPAVKAAEVLVRDVPIYLEAIGQTRGNTEIEIRARVEGFIESVDFTEGTVVRKGQLLYTIDPRPFEASLAQAKADLAQAEADLQRAHQDVVLYEPLVAKNAISRQQYDTAVAVERAQASAVEAARGGGPERRARPELHPGARSRHRPRRQDRGLSGDAGRDAGRAPC